MRVLESGHSYELASYRPPGGTQVWVEPRLFFFKKVGAGFPGNEGDPHTGTNCQEVLRALIDRVRYLQGQAMILVDLESAEDDRVILHHLRMALMRFEHRAARLKGTTIPACLVLTEIERAVPCAVCGHIFAHEHDEEE